MKLEWKIIEDEPPWDGVDCLVYYYSGYKGYMTIGYYDQDHSKWYDESSEEVIGAVAYIFLHDIPRPMRPVITNDEWVTNAARSGMFK